MLNDFISFFENLFFIPGLIYFFSFFIIHFNLSLIIELELINYLTLIWIKNYD